jgi:hypothetical protein
MALTLGLADSAVAQDFHKGGFFDSDVSQTGFFSNEQAGLPVKTNATASKSKIDSFALSPQEAAGLQLETAAAENKERSQSDTTSDSFEVGTSKD